MSVVAPESEVDVAVVGGGMVGLASAIALRERGLSVLLLDPGEARGRTSYGNAGVISRGSIFPMSSPPSGEAPDLPAQCRPGPSPASRPRRTGHPLDHAFPGRRPGLRLGTGERGPAPADERGLRRACAPRRAAGAAHLLTRPGWIKLYRTEADFAARPWSGRSCSGTASNSRSSIPMRSAWRSPPSRAAMRAACCFPRRGR